MKAKKVVLIAVAFAFVALLGIMAAFMFVPTSRIGCDYDLRMNEARCVRQGVDPFDVWSEKVEFAPYCSAAQNKNPSVFTRRVNAYPPWAYTYAFAWDWLPEMPGWYLYFAFNLVALLFFVWFGYRYALEKFGNKVDAALASVGAVFLVAFAIGSCFQSGNYPIPVWAALLLMIIALNRGHDILAGICWALAMTKPQMVLLLAIPLLLRRKFLVCTVAAGICLIASVLPCVLCHKGIVELIRNGIFGSSGAFMGCGTLPAFLMPIFGQTVSINLSLVVGLVLCTWLTLKTPRTSDWLTLLTPALFIGSVWTYSQLYASVTVWFAALLMLIALVRKPTSKVLWFMVIASFVFISRLYTFIHGFILLLPARWHYSYELHGHLDSINSFIGLLVFVAFWLTIVHAENEEQQNV